MLRHMLIAAAAFAVSAGAAYADADAAAGAKYFKKKCGACHTATEAKNKVGPSLMGVVGRPVASVEGFKYSDSMIEFGAGKVWDAATLEAYLPKPKALVPKTKMAFAGVKEPEEIANLIAYLQDPSAVAE